MLSNETLIHFSTFFNRILNKKWRVFLVGFPKKIGVVELCNCAFIFVPILLLIFVEIFCVSMKKKVSFQIVHISSCIISWNFYNWYHLTSLDRPLLAFICWLQGEFSSLLVLKFVSYGWRTTSNPSIMSQIWSNQAQKPSSMTCSSF